MAHGATAPLVEPKVEVALEAADRVALIENGVIKGI